MIDQLQQFEDTALRNGMVNLYEGRLWFAQNVLDDIESFTGRRLTTENPREFSEFVSAECFRLRNITGDPARVMDAFHGFCVLKLLHYLVEHKMHGPEFAGQAPHVPQLLQQFHAEPETVLRPLAVH